MKRLGIWLLIIMLFFIGNGISFDQAKGDEKKGEYLLPGDVKAGQVLMSKSSNPVFRNLIS
ncbi:MAG: hypothetical protein ACXU9K_12315, partial [Thermodesulfobacteriota bacterium]